MKKGKERMIKIEKEIGGGLKRVEKNGGWKGEDRMIKIGRECKKREWI